MNSNRITSIESLGQLKNLNYLRLDFNTIKTNIDNILGQAFRNLKFLDFRNNKIRSIKSFSFSDYYDNNIENLILMNNNLNYLRDYPFHNLKNVVSINLDNNRLEFIEMMAFDSLKSIRKISLRNNSLKFIFNNIFSYINSDANLIDLSNNKINQIFEDSFKNTKTLSIDYESISSVDTIQLPIETLDLSEKNISVIVSN